MSTKINYNKVRILELPTKQFQGEAYLEGELIVATIKYPNKLNCIRALNKKIEEFNLLRNKKVPLMKNDGHEILFEITQKTVEQPAAEKTVENSETKIAENKPKAPKRKPFTPYGLNGYLVDKQGNVRLILDRRASAHTIVLEPEMFSAIADMVQRTQEQKNA